MTVLVWLLISLPGSYNKSATNSPSNHHPVVIERFQDSQECQRVGKLITQNSPDSLPHRNMCIQARIYVKE